MQGSPVPGFHTSLNRAVRLPLYAGGALEERERTDNPFPSASVPCFGRRGLPCGAGSNIPLLSRFDASNARIAVACCPVQLRLSLRGCSTATRHSPRQYPEFHSHPVPQRRRRRGGYRHARPRLRFKVPHSRRVLNPFHAQLHAFGCHSPSTWARCYPVPEGEGLSPSWKLSSLTPPSERE